MIMKKSTLLVAAFLLGITTQANVKLENTLHRPIGNYERYLSTQSVQFIEAGVLYEVFLDGSFTYSIPNNSVYRTPGRRNAARTNNGRRGNPNGNAYGRRVNAAAVFIDAFGVLQSVGRTPINYNRNGKVNRIGSVQLRYLRGRLLRVGNMHIFYNHSGAVSHTLGNINRRNPVLGVCGVAPAVLYSNYGQRGRTVAINRYYGSNFNRTYAYNDYNSVNVGNRQRSRH